METMRPRTIRTDDALWKDATGQATREGVAISEVVRHALRRYTGNYAGTIRVGSTDDADIFGGALVLSGWKDADPERHLFEVRGCKVEMKGLDLVISPDTEERVYQAIGVPGPGESCARFTRTYFVGPARAIEPPTGDI